MFKKQKGITLISLIITIIVMLILVGVTISVALNGGLFQKAETAAEEMQIKAEEEELLSAVVAAIGTDGKVVLGDIQLPTGWTGSNGTYTSPKGNIYEVDENGKITYIGKDSGGGKEPVAFDWRSVGLNVDTNTYYEFYDSRFDTMYLINFTESGELIVKENNTVLEPIDATDEKNIDSNGNLTFLFTYNGTTYPTTITMNSNGTDIDVCLKDFATITYKEKIIYTNEEVLEKLGITNNTGTYNGTWTVIGKQGNKIKLATSEPVTNYTLGFEDPRAISAISVKDENQLTETEKLERAIWSYMNLVNTLNVEAQENTGISSARSITLQDIYDIIGEENVDKRLEYGEYGKIYNYYFDSTSSKVYSKYKIGVDENGNDIWSTPIDTGYEAQTFVNDKGEKIVVDSVGDQVTLTYTFYDDYTLTDEQRVKMGYLAEGGYWLASYSADCSEYVYYEVRQMYTNNIGCYPLFKSIEPYQWCENEGVIAVISI